MNTQQPNTQQQQQQHDNTTHNKPQTWTRKHPIQKTPNTINNLKYNPQQPTKMNTQTQYNTQHNKTTSTHNYNTQKPTTMNTQKQQNEQTQIRNTTHKNPQQLTHTKN